MGTIEERNPGGCSTAGKTPVFMASATSLFTETEGKCKNKENVTSLVSGGEMWYHDGELASQVV